ncbi:hypothetical protein ACMZ7J_05560 [Gardnerella greenwoodii]|uniref:hypothetical protein n=1 Tax=Gardnerella greenwoodii TaxID=2914925 RepID=UPI00030C731E
MTSAAALMLVFADQQESALAKQNCKATKPLFAEALVQSFGNTASAEHWCKASGNFDGEYPAFARRPAFALKA